jgi:uncharacterized Ntn-hydrolase superfamily protein
MIEPGHGERQGARLKKAVGRASHGARAAMAALVLCSTAASAEPPRPATFSIVAADPQAGEVGVAVASRFFAVGSVVPWARAGVGAFATQANANTTFGPRGLELLERGVRPQEALDVLLRADGGRDRRQVGVVSADGSSATHTGAGCTAWAGGRHGPGYAVQGNILAGEGVVAAMEKRFLDTRGQPLAERLLEALIAGDAAGGDSRGRQSAALLVVRHRGGYNGFTDRAIDVRVDDHADPMGEIARLTRLALVNDAWNRGWTAFTEKRYPEALSWQRRTAEMAQGTPAVLPEVLYDLAVILQANGASDEAWAALQRALSLNPRLRDQALRDDDLAALRPRLREGASFEPARSRTSAQARWRERASQASQATAARTGGRATQTSSAPRGAREASPSKWSPVPQRFTDTQ